MHRGKGRSGCSEPSISPSCSAGDLVVSSFGVSAAGFEEEPLLAFVASEQDGAIVLEKL